MIEPVPEDNKASMVEAWAKGWAIARGVSPPVRDHEGFRTDPGWPDQVRRYVFAEINEGFKALAREIHDPWIFLKVCATAELVREWLPERWVIESPRFMMICFKPMHQLPISLPVGYTLRVEEGPAISVVSVVHDNVIVAIGRVVVVDDHAIYDRIETIPEHRRLGLASLVMLELEAMASARGGRKGILVATTEGKKLYEALGWDMYSAYTTAVIRGQEEHP